MDVSVVRDISRMCFLTLFPSYAKGTHMQKHKIQARKIIQYSKEKVLKITANGESLRLCTDGEITTPEDGGVFCRAGRFQVYCAGGTLEARGFKVMEIMEIIVATRLIFMYTYYCSLNKTVAQTNSKHLWRVVRVVDRAALEMLCP